MLLVGAEDVFFLLYWILPLYIFIVWFPIRHSSRLHHLLYLMANAHCIFFQFCLALTMHGSLYLVPKGRSGITTCSHNALDILRFL